MLLIYKYKFLDQKVYISELVGMIGFHMDIIYFEWIELSTKFIPYLGFCGGLKYSSPSFPFNPPITPPTTPFPMDMVDET